MAKRTFFLVLLVTLVLVGMYFLPQISIAGYDFRQVNLLSDIMKDSAEVDTARTEGENPKTEYVDYKDSVPAGMVPIEDFRDSLGIDREMDKFYEALRSAKKRPVRIAYFGDSFIEGDILTAAVRDLLQTRFGGRGVGFVDIQSQVAGFRTTVLSHSKGWTEYAAVYGKGFNPQLQGINSRYYIPAPGAEIDMRGQNRVYAGHLDTVQVATLFFSPQQGLTMNCSVNGGDFRPFYTAPEDSIADEIQSCTVNGKIGRVDIKVAGNGRFYGLALENKTGIVLDNFSMRGSIGWHLGQIPQDVLNQFARLRNYDLIIMHFGLNMAAPSTHNYSRFCEKFETGLNLFRKAYPNASILVFSMSNRDARSANGTFRTMDGVEALVEAQREMARKEGVAFWNLQQGMGGSGSMVELQKEGKANRDYTHINFRGGEHIGKIFYDVLMNGKMNFDLRKGYVTKEQLKKQAEHKSAHGGQHKKHPNSSDSINNK